jgi:hypothetical protein
MAKTTKKTKRGKMEGKSDDYIFYSNIFPEQRVVLKPSETSLSYHALKQMLGDRFLLNNLDEIFHSWKSSKDLLNFQLPTSTRENKQYMIYDHDHHKYQSTVYIHSPSGGFPDLTIKLANNGFIYPHDGELQVDQRRVSRHHGNDWCVLSESNLIHFKRMSNFCKQYLGDDGSLCCCLYYNFNSDRFDFKAHKKSNKKGVVITFEPGYPMDHDLDTDHWYPL